MPGDRTTRGDGIELRAAATLPPTIERLVDAGRAEGYAFPGRLVAEWNSGENRFSAPGEVFLLLYRGEELCGFGGLNVDPFAGDPRTGRLRRVYVDPPMRGRGLGRRLIRALIERGAAHFSRIRVRTDHAAALYEQLGFVRFDEPDASHVLHLAPPGGD